ncbi:MAG TPA: rhodanese-like domain-containing protein [Anaeromyxobacter sp.]|nr:rhodanese-like domain-containing protein [Anaeromyxobacter sp.]
MPTRPSPARRVAPLLAAAALAAACTANRSGEPFTLVTLDEVERMLGDPGVAIVDANTPETFRAGHLPGARWYREGPSLASVLPADRTRRIVFYCASPT